MSTVGIISTNLDIRPDSWRDQLPFVRYTTSTFEISDTVPSSARRQWQLTLITVFQRVAFGDADSGPVQDVADWCLRQGLRLLNLYPEDIEILSCEFSSSPTCQCPLTSSVIGRNWLSRAQKSLANIYRADRGSSSSSAASASASQDSEAKRERALAEAEQALNTADYVEARGILSPAVDYLQRAVTAAYARGTVSGTVLVTVRNTSAV
ncbi:hypothetical protein IQ06DRAFT_288991 [Phaeosphaeriaceae sp. SRC1lsM3a]|nr:hypothetical protein IQ06DRAFT_288991 [Stagonospora sp. SRC1lsM3a]